MNLTKKHKILIIGLGLIGGSYAEALTSWGFEVGAITKDRDSIDFALKKESYNRVFRLLKKNMYKCLTLLSLLCILKYL